MPATCWPVARVRSATCSRTGSPTSTRSWRSVERVAAGGTVLDPKVVAALVNGAARPRPLARLTAREQEVLALMAEGRSNAAIAARMFVTEKAVGKHTNNIFAKLDLPPAPDDNRRVLAVLAWLDGSWK